MGGFPVASFTTLDSNGGFEQASKKIREAMRERGEMRRRKSQAGRGGWMVHGDDDETDSEAEDKGEYDEARKKTS